MAEARLMVPERLGLGERTAFVEVYDRFGDLVFDFCRFGLSDEAAELATVTTFELLACGRLPGLDDPTRLKPWLLGLAQGVLRRWPEGQHRARIDELPELAGAAPELAGAAPELAGAAPEPAAAARRVLEVAAWGLERDDRELLALYLLEVRRRITRVELARARGFARGCSDARLVRLRERLDEAIVAVVVARGARAACAELGRILAVWQGLVSPALCKRVLRHARRCGVCGRCRAQVDPGEILVAMPPATAPAALRWRVLIALQRAAPSASGRPEPAVHGGRQQLVRVAAAIALAAVASLVVWLPGRARPVPVPFAASSGSGSASAAPAARHAPAAGPSGLQVRGSGSASSASLAPGNVRLTVDLSLAPSVASIAGGSPPASAPSSSVGGSAPGLGHGWGRGLGVGGGHSGKPANPGSHGHRNDGSAGGNGPGNGNGNGNGEIHGHS